MWHTERGQVCFKGKEGQLLKMGLMSLAQELRDSHEIGDDYTLGLKAFDRLTYNQRVWTLHTIAQALFREDVSAPHLSAYLESGVATVFRQILIDIEIEIEIDMESKNWRTMVTAALQEIGTKLEVDTSCEDVDEWGMEIEILEARIFWDADYETIDLVEDAPPEQSAEWLKKFGTADDYYTAFPPDPTDDEAEQLFNELIAGTHNARGQGRKH